MDNIILGRWPVLEALKSGQPIERILLLHGTKGNILNKIQQLAREKNIPIKETSQDRFSETKGHESAQGVIAIISDFLYTEIEEILSIAKGKNESPFLFILDEIEDPQNLGALIRTAECAGVHGIIIPKHHAASVNVTVTKTSAGAISYVPIARVTNIAQTIEELKKSGLWIVGTDRNGDRLYFEIDYKGPIAIIIGNESKGIRKLVKEKCDFIVRIPMYGKTESLNASVAGGLVLFEAARMRHS